MLLNILINKSFVGILNIIVDTAFCIGEPHAGEFMKTSRYCVQIKKFGLIIVIGLANLSLRIENKFLVEVIKSYKRELFMYKFHILSQP